MITEYDLLLGILLAIGIVIVLLTAMIHPILISIESELKVFNGRPTPINRAETSFEVDDYMEAFEGDLINPDKRINTL